MNRYKVKAGTHIEAGRRYTKDQVVTSGNDLIKLFPEKFELVGPAPEGKRKDTPPPATPKGPALVTSPPAKASSTLPRSKAGSHTESKLTDGTKKAPVEGDDDWDAAKETKG